MEHSHIGVSILGLLGLVLVGAFVLAAFVFWICMLIHAITNPGLRDVEKLLWVIVILFVHALGALLYFFIGRPKKYATGPPGAA
jgi:hypothetical protein